MTESEFWLFLEALWEERERASMIAGTIDSPLFEIQTQNDYIGGHALLPNEHTQIPEQCITDMGKLLFENVKQNTKEAILMILAHQPTRKALSILREYCKTPDENLRYFAEIALWECKMWNE
ncbi:MAG: hypothetical protein JW844_00700 [Candidatus Omnitrophica bacterium]|nr:hypothetical protein [Candidatus Omnitrophota bacterium]